MKPFRILLDSSKFKKDFVNQLALYLGPEMDEAEIALVNKVRNIVEYKGDLKGAYQMLKSFKKGLKRLPTDKYGGSGDASERGDCIMTNHGEAFKGGPNLKRAHFRWDHGVRYTLKHSSLQKIEMFLEEHF